MKDNTKKKPKKYKDVPRGIFTKHKVEDLEWALKRINEGELSVELFDAFLDEYTRTKSLAKSIFRASCEWDC